MTGERFTTAVVNITRDRLDEAAEVLATAFRDYPMMRFFFGEGQDASLAHAREAFRFTCEARVGRGERAKGIVEDGRLVAVACLDGPEKDPWPEELERSFDAFAARVGDGVIQRFERYGELTATHRPESPHFYVVAIGVLPACQGRGFGRALLDEAHRMSAAHPASTGVGLDTETPGNVSFYERLGYRVTAMTRLDDVDVWCMFRPDDPSV